MFPIKVTIDFSTGSDTTEIGEISRSEVEYGFRWSYTPERLARILSSPDKNIVAAKSKDKLLGFGIMSYHDEHANLDLLAVKFQYRRRSIGSQIVAWLLEVAKTAGITQVFVQVRKLNLGAIKFYEELGFQVIDEIPGYYHGQETGVILCNSLVGITDISRMPL